MNAMIANTPINANGIHNGEKTHNQLQYVTGPTSANFKVKNIRNKIVPNPNPLFDLSFCSGIN